MEKINWESGATLIGYMVVMAMIAVGIIGLIAFMGEMDTYYSPLKNGTVDPAGIASSGMYNQTFNMTKVLVDAGGYVPLLIFIVVFVMIAFGVVYVIVKR